MKYLRRSTKNKALAGVLGGFGEYFGADPVLLRVLFILFVLVTGIFPGVIGYILAAAIMPLDTDPIVHTVHDEGNR